MWRWIPVAVIGCLSVAPGAAGAQAASGAGSSKQVPERLAFDSVTVRRRNPPVAVASLFPLGPGDEFVQTGGRFEATDNLLHFIAFAYKLQPHEVTRLAYAGPEWIHAVTFEIDARTSRPNVTRDQMRLMMQSLLADQFRLAIHKEVQQVPVLKLTLAKPGIADPDLKPHLDKGGCTKSNAPGACRGVIVNLGEPCTACRQIRAEGLSMAQFAAFLTAQTKPRTVVDRTGLTGIYDFRFSWDPGADLRFMPNSLPLTMPIPAGATVGDQSLDPGPTRPSGLAKALKEQLRLTLVPGSQPRQVYVIDRAEQPK